MRDYNENITGINKTDGHYGDTDKQRVTPENVAYQDEISIWL